jgi:hypothetical protein
MSEHESIPPEAPYERFAVRGAWVVALPAHAAAVREALAGGTLYDWASKRPGAEPLRGRGIAWAAVLPDGTRVVVRHSRHGGALAPLTRDLFLAPTRAPRELAAARRLAERAVPTPEVIAYAVYPYWGPLCRADVVTARLEGVDFPASWRAAHDEALRAQLVDALAALFNALRAAGARHPDLQLKNVFVTRDQTGTVAWMLDVDRVSFHTPHSPIVAQANLERLARSIRSWRARGVDFGPADAARLAAALDLRDVPGANAALDALGAEPGRTPARP